MEKQKNTSVAIIGMSCFFAQSSNLKKYWRLLYHGVDTISDIPATHWSSKDYFNSDPKKPDHTYCKKGAFLSPINFDPTEFGIPPSSLEATDTSQILGLMAAKIALEDSGYDKKPFNRDKASVILGVTGTQELVIPLSSRLGHPVWRKALKHADISDVKADKAMKYMADSYVSWQENSFPGLLGNVVAGRICNRLDLGGTNCVVDAACASSMGALHLSCLELVSNRSDMVITGGVDTLNDIFMQMCFSKTFVLSSSGDIKPFSKDADGTILGEGIGLLVLKRLEDAEKDGDRIYAVIKGIGSSSDGKSQSIYSPSKEGQIKAIAKAYKNAGIPPDTVELVEAHGTGTKVGDIVEFQGLSSYFKKFTKKKKICALGSVKSMIGHTKAAAGASGLIKTALSLYNKVLPCTLKADKPDPDLNIDNSPFYLNTETRPWFSKTSKPRRAGVSSFGFGGSNFHVVLEEYKSIKQEISWDGSIEIVALSTPTKKDLKKLLTDFSNSVKNSLSINEISTHASETRQNFSPEDQYKMLMLIENSSDDFLSLQKDLSELFSDASCILEQKNSRKKISSLKFFKNIFYNDNNSSDHTKQEKIAFVFPGQGSQYVGMLRDIVSFFPEAFDVLKKANEKYHGEILLTDIIYPHPASSKEKQQSQAENLKNTKTAQPAIGAVSLAMLKVLQYFGVKPDVTCGHSFGELTALCSAGWIDEHTFFNLSNIRGKVMASAGNKNSGMLAVTAPVDELASLIKNAGSDLVIANKNGPNQGVLSGSIESIVKIEKICIQKKYHTIRLPVSAAFHSSFVKNAQKPFKEALSDINITPTNIPVFSNTTGNQYPDDPEETKKLLGKQIICPVDFLSEIKNIYKSGIKTFIEIGPKPILSGLIKSILKKYDFQTIAMDSSSGKQFAVADLARVLCQLASSGININLNKWENQVTESRKKLMQIPVTGANFTKNNRNNQSSDKKELITKQSQISIIPTDRHTDQYICGDKVKMADQKAKQKHSVDNAIKAVQESLNSIQVLQMQTIETHKVFLETQAATSKSLQDILRDTQNMIADSIKKSDSYNEVLPQAFSSPSEHDLSSQNQLSKPDGIQAKPLPQAFSSPSEHDLSLNNDLPLKQDMQSNMPPAPFMLSEALSQTKPYTSHSDFSLNNDFASQNNNNIQNAQTVSINVNQLLVPEMEETKGQTSYLSKIEENLIKVVSDLTGYPKEMINPDFDLEADLGIDSIKKVEILSSMQELMPNLPAISPDNMPNLKSLTQIINYLKNKNPLYKTEKEPFLQNNTNITPINVDLNKIKENLIKVVSDLTGYPKEMINPDFDLEADLGIDSIKKVEILSSMQELMPNLPAISPDNMPNLKSLTQIINYLKNENPENLQPQINESKLTNVIKNKYDETAQTFESIDNELYSPCDNIERKTITVVEKTFKSENKLTIPDGKIVFVTDDNTKLSQAIADELSKKGIDSKVASYDLLLDMLTKKQGKSQTGGLVILPDKTVVNNQSTYFEDETFLKKAFLLAKLAAHDLFNSAEEKGALFATVTRQDSAFGFKRKNIYNPMQSGLSALSKTAAVEWENVTCHAIDIDPYWTKSNEIAKACVKIFLTKNSFNLSGSIETGISEKANLNTCFSLQLKPLPYNFNESCNINLNNEDVVIVTGGAKGITASCIQALSNKIQSKIVLIGRSLPPFPEPFWLADLTDESEIKKKILENEFNANQNKSYPLAAELEKSYKKQMANREIIQNIQKLKSNGATVRYYSADVCDFSEIKCIINEVKNTLGPVKAIIHGAGIVDDHLIKDKTEKQFDVVFNTKVKGLHALLEATKDDMLKYIVLFSSISARIGNTGQVDYAMANEVLNKIAMQESLKRADCKMLSINWGPWDKGMVSPLLKRRFEKNNIALIPSETGALCMLYEMADTKNEHVEVVVGSHMIKSAEKKNGNNAEKLSIVFKNEIDVQSHPILNSHTLNGKPVVPFALMTEWIWHGALHENPDLYILGFDDMRMLNGIKLDKGKKSIHLLSGKSRKKGLFFEVSVEIRNGIHGEKEFIHSKAKAILAQKISSPPLFKIPDMSDSNGYTTKIDKIYDNILFHGDKLKGIKKITGFSSKGMIANILPAPPPSEWIIKPFRNKWIGDPLVLDSAFQMASLWCHEVKGAVCLPVYTAFYRQYRNNFPSEETTIIFQIDEVLKNKIKGDFTFVDSDRKVIAAIKGFEGIMDLSLNKAFKP